MFSEASGHIVVLCIAAGKCSFLVGVYKLSTGFIQIILETITRNTVGFCFSVMNPVAIGTTPFMLLLTSHTQETKAVISLINKEIFVFLKHT